MDPAEKMVFFGIPTDIALSYLALFAFGTMGALAVVYLRQRQAVPDFPGFADDKAYARLAERLKEAQRDLDVVQKRIARFDESHPAGTKELEFRDRLRADEAALTKRVDGAARRMDRLEWRGWFVGILVYVAIGGTLAAILAAAVTIQVPGLVVSRWATALAVGAAWPHYLGLLVRTKDTTLLTDEAVTKLQEGVEDRLKKLEDQLPLTAPPEAAELLRSVRVEVKQQIATAKGEMSSALKTYM